MALATEVYRLKYSAEYGEANEYDRSSSDMSEKYVF